MKIHKFLFFMSGITLGLSIAASIIGVISIFGLIISLTSLLLAILWEDD